MENNYEFTDTNARIAVYDDLLSSPRIIDITPSRTREFINNIASTVYSAASEKGGKIPYTIILQVAENFIHANFKDVIVSIINNGNTIRFADQGPGINDVTKAIQPGFSSATAEMKKIIYGVGSGLPIVNEYIQMSGGEILIENNIDSGAVITINISDKLLDYKNSEIKESDNKITKTAINEEELILASVSEKGKKILNLFLINDTWRIKDISNEINIAPSTVFNELKKLQEAGLISTLGKRRVLSEMGCYFLKGQFK